jgi:hypothetical protein
MTPPEIAARLRVIGFLAANPFDPNGHPDISIAIANWIAALRLECRSPDPDVATAVAAIVDDLERQVLGIVMGASAASGRLQ